VSVHDVLVEINKPGFVPLTIITMGNKIFLPASVYMAEI
jgi:hypothetical protein